MWSSRVTTNGRPVNRYSNTNLLVFLIDTDSTNLCRLKKMLLLQKQQILISKNFLSLHEM